jgi:hydrogenase maturation factor
MQTSGGLLAAVPSQSAEATVAALKEMGYSDSVVIGEFFSTRSQAAPGEFEPSIWVDDE